MYYSDGKKTGVLLINLGTPDSPSVGNVRKYLKEFLMDPFVIDIPYWKRYLIVNWLIIPARVKNSAFTYQQVWTKDGSPLLVFSEKLKKKLCDTLGNDYVVELAMRYQSPSINSAIKNLKNYNLKNLIIIPLFPQYAEATTRSVIEYLKKALIKSGMNMETSYIPHFHDNDDFIKSFVEIGKSHNPDQYDHIIFSFHGLPQRHIQKAISQGLPNYQQQCFETANLIARGLALSKDKFTICFQSRLGNETWLGPYTTDIVKNMALNNKKKILLFSPSFVCDCLETIYEVKIEYAEEFKKHGGQRLDLVESLNDRDIWIESLKKLICNNNHYKIQFEK